MSQVGPSIQDESDTITLLQDEIARLEAELELRDEALRCAAISTSDPATADPVEDLRPMVAELKAEIDERDRVIVLLLEESRHYEEAADVQRQEWEQLSRWVEEVEKRIDETSSDAGLAATLDRERRETDQVRRDWLSERRAWDAERAAMAQEAEQLRERLAISRSGGLSTDAAYLDRENQQLRASLQHAARHVTLAEEVGPLRQQLAAAHEEIEHLNTALRQESDDRKREAMESEATIRTLHSKLARLSSETQEVAANSLDSEPGTDAYREVDERIRAFRQHLRELHDREEAERSARSLTSRLSRLWRSTGPG